MKNSVLFLLKSPTNNPLKAFGSITELDIELTLAQSRNLIRHGSTRRYYRSPSVSIRNPWGRLWDNESEIVGGGEPGEFNHSSFDGQAEEVFVTQYGVES
jgi:hypothetical protein